MIGTRIEKDDYVRYQGCANWCNETQLGVIKDMGDYYEVVENPYHESEQISAIKSELEDLSQYLDSTDWMVIKCMERGLDMKTEYPNEFAERQKARDKINELRSIINDNI